MSNLFNKYRVEKQDGSPVDPKAQYFVLRIDTDPVARYAVYAYAAFISGSDDEFADELRAWVKQYGGAVEQMRAPDFAETCRQIGHWWVNGVCQQCGLKEPQSG
jgi:alkanesulfonate monooxygenase SsuD/methylene tetrahydromethanopterin reductase-like flavin-dependent oxidoreductase (luciferase family)